MTRADRPTRRKFLQQVLAAAAANQAIACGGDSDTAPAAPAGDAGAEGATGDSASSAPDAGVETDAPDLPSDPFTLGVASGDPLPDSVILWTRLAPKPLEPKGGMPDEAISVGWELAATEDFTGIVQSGLVSATPVFGHALHIDVKGLEPDTWYWYRFKVGSHVSAIGRTRTTPALGAAPARLRFATACCQNFANGFYTAYQHMAGEELDLVVFLGDYIYEGAGSDVREHGDVEPTTLDQYRVRHALYKTDKNLRAAHARCPWLMIWDDHEVENNYAGDHSQAGATIAAFRERRAAAYRAYYEHMPLRLPPPEGPDYKIYHSLRWGDLVEFFLLDTRQYRSDQNCLGVLGPGCPGWAEFDGTLLGAEQESWLTGGLAASDAVWKLVAQQIVFSTVSLGGLFVNFDQWDGYPKARQRLLDFISAERIENLVVLSGDIHVGGVADLTSTSGDAVSPIVATEIVTTSISSGANIDPALVELAFGGISLIKYINARSRGYVSHEITRDKYTIDCFTVDTVTTETSGGKVDRSFVVNAGTPGVGPA